MTDSNRPRIPDVDRVLDEMSRAVPSAAAESAAAARVRARLLEEAGAAHHAAAAAPPSGAITGCTGASGYQALIPARLDGTLDGPRALLLDDHVRECIPCRRALMAAGSAGAAASASSNAARRERAAGGRLWLAAAAAAVAVAGISAWRLGLIPGFAPPVQAAAIRDIHGEVFVGDPAAQGGMRVARAGQALGPNEVIRTAREGGAFVTLADGSLIEMRERSELSLGARSDGTAIRLTRGDIIVEAAKQAGGHLYVTTDDAVVSVVGTVFAVDAGVRGSRVSVLDGEVHVTHGASTTVLNPGDQVITDPGVAMTPIDQEFAWSREVDRHIALLSELASLRKDLDEQIALPPARRDTRLLDSAPAGTIVFASLPNLSEGLGGARRLIHDRIEKNEVLKTWWDETMTDGNRSRFDEALSQMQALGEQLGPEIAVSVTLDDTGDFGGLAMVSELRHPTLFARALPAEVAKVNAAAHEGAPRLRLLPATLPAALPERSGHDLQELLLWTHRDLILAGTSLEMIRAIGAAADSGGSAAFSESPFHARLAEAYADGVEVLVGVDVSAVVQHLIAAQARQTSEANEDMQTHLDMLRLSGFLDMKHLIVERQGDGDRTTDTAVLTFDQPRRGIASWLAPPAPMGALQFVSPDASFVAAAVVKEPVRLADDLFAILASASPEFGSHLSEFEEKSGLSLREDLAASMGGEVALALDGPILPTPSWKVVAEVYDPVAFQAALEKLVTEVNEGLEKHQDVQVNGTAPHLVIERDDSGGRTVWTMRTEGASLAARWMFADGYLVMAPSRALLDRALELRAARTTIANSPALRALMPRDGRLDFSALMYQDFRSIAGPLARTLQGIGGDLTPAQEAALDDLGGRLEPTLAWAYAEDNRILVAGTRNGRGFGSELAALFGMGGPLDAAPLAGLLAGHLAEAHGAPGGGTP